MIQYIVVDEISADEEKHILAEIADILNTRAFQTVAMCDIATVQLREGEEIYLVTHNYADSYAKLPEQLREHIASVIAEDVELPCFYTFGSNLRIARDVDLGMDIILGNNVVLDRYSNISHDSTVEDDCQIGYRVTVGGGCHVGNHVTIRTGAVLKEDTTVGDGAYIKTASVVLKDVDADGKVMGNPARMMR